MCMGISWCFVSGRNSLSGCVCVFVARLTQMDYCIYVKRPAGVQSSQSHRSGTYRHTVYLCFSKLAVEGFGNEFAQYVAYHTRSTTYYAFPVIKYFGKYNLLKSNTCWVS